MKSNNQTIVALSTPTGNGAIALIRISGDEAMGITSKISRLHGSKKLDKQPSHTVHHGWVINKSNIALDEVMFIVMRGPHTFTGEDTVEITCHNNQFIIESIIKEILGNGARLANRGEFTQRAFENEKIDLMQAEAINELICAQTEMALKKSLAQLKGTLSKEIVEIERELIKSLAWSEASFEHLEDEGDFGEQIRKRIKKILKKIEIINKNYDIRKQIREGVRIVLLGSVNAGKSSLFNKILDQDRSIVTKVAGTTRDVIEAGIYRGQHYWTLIDTAGLRTTKNIIEKEGIKRSLDQAKKSDIIILAIDGSRNISTGISTEEKKIYKKLMKDFSDKIIIVQTKIDKKSIDLQKEFPKELPEEFSGIIKISSLTGKNINKLKKHIEQKINKIFEVADSPFLLNKRQFKIITVLKEKLIKIIEMLSGEIAYEIVSHHLQESIEDVSKLTGRTVREQAIDVLFKEFCVGK